MIHRILLAYDGSECANHAAAYAGELAVKFGADLLVVYAFHHVPRSWAASLVENALQAERRQGEALVGAIVEELHAKGIRAEGHVVEGPAAQAILQTARTFDIDTIVLGSRGLGQATASLMGSVSEQVARGSHCPVVIVK